MSLPTLNSVQKLQAALHAKAKGEPETRFYTLYDKVYRQDVLWQAHRCCRINGGAPGVDGQTFENISATGSVAAGTTVTAGTALVGVNTSISGLTGSVVASRYVGQTAATAPTTAPTNPQNAACSVNGIALFLCINSINHANARITNNIVPTGTNPSLWQRLNAAAPARGLAKPQAAAESVMIAPWPEPDESLVNQEIEARFARFQTVLGGLREMRARQGIAPKANVEFMLRCDDETAKLLEPMRLYFTSMAAATATEIGSTVAAPPISAHFTAAGIDVYVDLAEHIDVAAEISRKEKEIAKFAQMIAGKEKQLSNEAFVSRAPKAVIEKEQAALEELRATKKSTEATLQTLQAAGKPQRRGDVRH
jgi:hypothetical protein